MDYFFLNIMYMIVNIPKTHDVSTLNNNINKGLLDSLVLR